MVSHIGIRNSLGTYPGTVGKREVNKTTTACPGQGHSPGAWEGQGEFCGGTGPITGEVNSNRQGTRKGLIKFAAQT